MTEAWNRKGGSARRRVYATPSRRRLHYEKEGTWSGKIRYGREERRKGEEVTLCTGGGGGGVGCLCQPLLPPLAARTAKRVARLRQRSLEALDDRVGHLAVDVVEGLDGGRLLSEDVALEPVGERLGHLVADEDARRHGEDLIQLLEGTAW